MCDTLHPTMPPAASRLARGCAVEAVARELCIPRSTARLWAAQDGFRLMDLEAKAAGTEASPPGDWAKPGRRGRKGENAAPEGEEFPYSEYPELQALSGSARLSRLHDLARAGEMRTVAAIEAGCLSFAFASLREAQRLRRAWRLLRDWLEKYPEPEAAGDENDWRAEIQADFERLTTGAPAEPVRIVPDEEPSPDDLLSRRIWQAIEEARRVEAAELSALWGEEVSPDGLATFPDDVDEYWRLTATYQKYLSLPGRTLPPIQVALPPRRRPGQVKGPEEGGYVPSVMKPALPPEMREGWEAAERERANKR